MNGIRINVGPLTLTRFYPPDHEVWKLPAHRQRLMVIADAGVDLKRETESLEFEQASKGEAS